MNTTTAPTLQDYIKQAQRHGVEGVFEAAAEHLSVGNLASLEIALREINPKWKPPKATTIAVEPESESPPAPAVTTTPSLALVPRDEEVTGEIVTGRSPDEIGDELREVCDRIETAERMTVEYWRQAGALLIEAKTAVPHGQWGPWLAANFPKSQSTADRYMQVARTVPELDGPAMFSTGGATIPATLRQIAHGAEFDPESDEERAKREAIFDEARKRRQRQVEKAQHEEVVIHREREQKTAARFERKRDKQREEYEQALAAITDEQAAEILEMYQRHGYSGVKPENIKDSIVRGGYDRHDLDREAIDGGGSSYGALARVSSSVQAWRQARERVSVERLRRIVPAADRRAWLKEAKAVRVELDLFVKFLEEIAASTPPSGIATSAATTSKCEFCGVEFVPSDPRRPPRFCTPAHKTAAWRAAQKAAS